MAYIKATLSVLAALVAATVSAAPPTLQPASHVQFPHATDSNSPGHWDGSRFYLFNSTGHPYRSYGSNVFQLGNTAAVTFNNTVSGGRWMEATWRDTNGTLYGWYHNEPSGLCSGTTLTAPRIGAARSTDNGANWTDLGIILEAPPGTLKCDSQNGYFAGGNGDFSVMLDDAQQYLYLFISTYAGDVTEQGVAVARMAWSDRDAPAGKAWKWYNTSWQSAGIGGHVTPTFPATVAWENANAQAYWGPSVHWNTYLQQYAMLLNRANSGNFAQEGIYISYSTNLADPLGWSVPEKIRSGGAWYPQVIGLEPGQGTDKFAGAVARYFQGGVSDFEISFVLPPSIPGWISYLDGSTLPAAPWIQYYNEGSAVITNIGGTNNALRLDSPAHSSDSPRHYNEYYVETFGSTEVMGAARFRLVSFSGTGKENLLSVTVGGAMPVAPSITVVSNNFWVWSYISDEPILDLGPANTNFHTAYILAVNDGTAQVWWDGAYVVEGPVPVTPNYDGYVEFGSGTYWETTAATVVDFDWVGWGAANKMPGKFTLRTSGSGNVVSTGSDSGTPTNGAYLQIGQTYSVTAVPGLNNLLSNWWSIVDGVTNVASSLAEYTFLMQPNLALYANFMTNFVTCDPWIEFLDGSSLPPSPWVFYQGGGTQGGTVVTNFLDPETGATNQALQINSGANSSEWYLGRLFVDEVVAAARFRTVGFSGTGSENLLCAEVGGAGDHSAAPAITIVTSRYKLWSYTEGTFGSGTGGSQILDLGPVVLNQFHTAYLYAHKSGITRLWWDGVLLFDGMAPAVKPYDGYIEWGSGAWQFTEATTVDFDWIGYGNACSLPQLLRITGAENAVVLSWPTNAAGFVLQYTDTLSAPNWINVTNTVGIVGSENAVTNYLSNTNKFFRLRQL